METKSFDELPATHWMFRVWVDVTFAFPGQLTQNADWHPTLECPVVTDEEAVAELERRGSK